MYDIVIIGAGPAGATLARLLDRKYKVLLVDNRSLNGESNKKTKCCGGLLAPDAQKMLAKLGLGIPQSILTGPQMFSVKTIDFDNGIERFYQRHYINVDREKLDEWMVSLISDHVEVNFDCTYTSYEKKDNSILVHLRQNNKKLSVETKILVGADGAISRVRKQSFLDEKSPDTYVSIQKWYKTEGEMPYYTSVFDIEITDFYSWIIQKDKYLLIGTAIPLKEDANKKYDLLINKLKNHGYNLGEVHRRTGTLIMRTRSVNQINSLKENVVLIGEAAGFISPSSAEGISYALMSGSLLAKAINKNFINYQHAYQKSIKRIKSNILIKNIKIPCMYNSFLRRLIMKSKLLSLDMNEY